MHNRTIHRESNLRYTDADIGLSKLPPASLDLIKNKRQDSGVEYGFSGNQVSSGVSINKPKYETIGNSMERVQSSRLNNVNRLIIDVDTTRSFAEKLSRSKESRYTIGRTIDKDIEIYKRITKEKIDEQNDAIDEEYQGIEKDYSNSNYQQNNGINPQPFGINNQNINNPLLPALINNLSNRYGIPTNTQQQNIQPNVAPKSQI